ncbi:MAG TPA: hypothetical protein VF746_27210 [Longimicrobium sp.]|jgi:hypothetical protein
MTIATGEAGSPPQARGARVDARPGAWGMGLALPLAVLALAVAAELVAILVLNGGRLVYSLDDPYIHMALAEEIARGHYGVNPGEVSSPSSSILWPLLLVPLARTALAGWAPLLLNLAAATGTVAIGARLLRLAAGDAPPRSREWMAGIAGVGLIVAGNQLFLVFGGMEHVLQIALAAAVVLGLVEESRTGRVPPWLAAAVVAGPLVRYEALAVSVPALAVLALRGHGRRAALLGALTAVPLAAFSLFLRSLGLPALPASVLVKGGGLAAAPGLHAVAVNALMNWNRLPGRLLAVTALALGVAVLARSRPREDRLLAAFGAAVVALHLAFGMVGYGGRYEAYVWTVAALCLAWVFRRPLARAAAAAGPVRAAAALAAGLAVFCALQIYLALMTPLGANNIHVQQHQMHRFLTQYWRAPVAANDIGWLTYRSDAHVLDLWGLASAEAMRARRARGGPEWMERMAAAKGAELAMIYDTWFPRRPASWRKVATLRLDGFRFTPADDEVQFYARTPHAAARAAALLPRFARTLPPGASLEVFPAADSATAAGDESGPDR